MTPPPKLLYKLNLDKIRQWFDEASFEQGVRYWENGNVRRVKLAENGMELNVQSSVKGSNSQVYHQDIEVYEYDGLIEVSGECSCPTSINCKHVAAALCELIDRHSITASSGEVDQPVENWLNQLSETTALSEKAEAEGELEQEKVQLLYMINPEPASEASSRFRLRASVYKSRVLKKGGSLIVSVPNERYPWTYDPINFISERLFGRHASIGIWGFGHVRLYSRERIQKMLEKGGVRVSGVEHLNHYLAGFFENYISTMFHRTVMSWVSASRQDSLTGGVQVSTGRGISSKMILKGRSVN